MISDLEQMFKVILEYMSFVNISSHSVEKMQHFTFSHAHSLYLQSYTDHWCTYSKNDLRRFTSFL